MRPVSFRRFLLLPAIAAALHAPASRPARAFDGKTLDEAYENVKVEGGSRARPLKLFLKALPPVRIFSRYGGLPKPAHGPLRPPLLSWNDYRGVIHCHSNLSHDSPGTAAEIARAANRVGLDFLIMTDHYSDRAVAEAPRGMLGRTLFIPGAEITTQMSGGRRSLLALGLEGPIGATGSPEQILGEVHRQGGLLFAGHLEGYDDASLNFPFDGFEIYNMHAAAKATSKGSLAVRGLLLPTEELFSPLLKVSPDNLHKWDQASARRFVAIVAGNDAHNNIRVLSHTLGHYEQMFHSVTTHVWAKALTRGDILEALRSGRSYISFDAVRDATGFSVLEADARGGRHWRIFAPEISHIVLRRGGRIVAQALGQELKFPIVAGEVYRVEVYLKGRPWIFAGPFSASAARS